MAVRAPAPGSSRGSARLRLTMLYGGMFLLLGTIIVVIIYVFTSVGTVVHRQVMPPLTTLVPPFALLKKPFDA